MNALTTLVNSVSDTATASYSYVGMHNAATAAIFIGIFVAFVLCVWAWCCEKGKLFIVAAPVVFLPVYFGLFWVTGLWNMGDNPASNFDVTAVHEQLTSNGVDISEEDLKGMIVESSSTFLQKPGTPQTAGVLHNGSVATLTITALVNEPSVDEKPMWGQRRIEQDTTVTWKVE